METERKQARSREKTERKPTEPDRKQRGNPAKQTEPWDCSFISICFHVFPLGMISGSMGFLSVSICKLTEKERTHRGNQSKQKEPWDCPSVFSLFPCASSLFYLWLHVFPLCFLSGSMGFLSVSSLFPWVPSLFLLFREKTERQPMDTERTRDILSAFL